MLSKNLMPQATVFLRLGQSTRPPLTCSLKLIEPKLQLSYGSSGISQQGLVASSLPKVGVGLSRSIVSRKAIPGSAVFQAYSAIKSNSLSARIVASASLVRGLIKRHGFLSTTAFINASLAPTETLKFLIVPSSAFMVIKSLMSGWSAFTMAILPPWRLDPWRILDKAAEKALIKSTGPEAAWGTFLTLSPWGRILEKLKPVPPLFLWTTAAWPKVLKIASIESAIGKTKQAASWPEPPGLPASNMAFPEQTNFLATI